jgi:hypothetical protein
MDILNFVKLIAKKNNLTIKSLGVLIGRGDSISFWRTVTAGNIKANELKTVIEATGEKLIIVYKGEEIEIK